MKESFDLESNRWDQGKGKNKEGDKGKGGDATGSSEAKNPQVPNAKTGCDFCGLKNHATGECKRRNACELCGFNNHGSYECRREPLWSLGPELCAAQVFNQSFFFIDEHIDMKAVRDKANTAIITVTSGELSSRQLEIEFMSIVNDNVWRWSAKQVADNKFVMRFPNAKMVQDFSRFNLGMKSVNAQISIEPWSSALGAKGKLQSAWFKVRGIPSDQRSIRTIAKVGGLVGKTIKIDENTRFNNDFVRINIACRDIYEVPESAESALSLFIYDFFYELEEPEQGLGGKKSQGVKVDQTDMQPSPKKQKVDGIKPSAGNETPKKDGPSVQKTGQYGCSANMNIPGHIKYTQSAPAKSKVGEKRSKPEDKFVLKDGEDEEEIIPAATYEPGESSEEKQNMEDEGSENDIAADGGTENVWLAQCDTCIDEKLVSMNDVGSKKSSVIISEIDEKNECQESGQDEVNGEKDGGQMLLNMENLVNPCAQMAGDRDKRRWSERVHKRMEGRLEAVRDEDGKMLPGLSNVEVQGKILDGVKILLACAHRVLARQQAPPLLQAAPGDDAEAEEDQ